MNRALVTAALLALAACGQAPDIGGIGGNDDDDDDASGPDGGDVDGGVDAEPAPDAPPGCVTPEQEAEMVGPEVDARIVINEFMAANALTIKDDLDAPSDWIELYNPTDEDIPLTGYTLTDDLSDGALCAIPPGVVLPAHGYLVFWADAVASNGPRHLDFRLDKAGGDIGLARPDGTWIDRVRYGEQETDFSAQRTPDGSSQWTVSWHPTAGGANRPGTGQPAPVENPAAPPEAVPAAGDTSAAFYDFDTVVQLSLEVSAAGVAALETDPFTYVPAHLVYDGRRYGPVGLRLKGQNSFQPFSKKPSLRINVDEYVDNAKFLGLDDLTLNNMSLDFSMMHERLSYRVAREAGIPASRANHLLLTVNNQFYGLYTNLETVKKQMIRRWFADDEGSLFEGTDVDFAAQYVPRFELEFGPDDRTLLSGVADALTATNPTQAIASAGQYADMAQFRRFWAMEAVVGQFDALPYSVPGDDFYVYADPTTQRLHFLPWGMDETFYSGDVDPTVVSSVLATRCKEAPACFQAFADQAWDVLALTEELDLEGLRQRVAAQIRPYLDLDTRKPYPTSEVLAYQQHLYWFLAGRRAYLGQTLPPPSQP